MNSSTGRTHAQKLTQEQIKRQIAELQACLKPEPDEDSTIPHLKVQKRKVQETTILAPATPSPKKKRKLDHQPFTKPLSRPVFQTVTQQHPSSNKVDKSKEFEKPAPSNFINKLASMKRKDDPVDFVEPTPRSTGFSEKPKEIDQSIQVEHLAHKRDERLALIEDLEPGPYEHNAPTNDPDFNTVEPHSNINLMSRLIPHEDFQDYLRGRYYLPPSRLYSAIRLLPDKQGYEVPVPGDWITIAVVAERGPIKLTRAPIKVEPAGVGQDEKKQWKGKAKAEPEKPSGKKYVNLKLIDFGARSGSSSSATGGTSVIRGDAFLTLLLFESDGFDLVSNDDGGKPKKVYKGGSRGAFEHLSKVKEGDVIALLNPKILKPFQRSNDSPHPVNNILALTPESASSIMVLGQSRDLGMCTVRRQDGKVCGSWCDKRVSDVCDYHVQNAVQRRRAARPEFSVGTSGMTTSSTNKRKSTYDPARQWGLKPEENTSTSGATYVLSGHIVTGSSSDPRTVYVAESMGREGQAKAKRKLAGKESDRALKELLERDKEGMRAVMKAREAHTGKAKHVELDKGRARGDQQSTAGKKRINKGFDSDEGESDSDEDDLRPNDDNMGKKTYPAGVIKSLGFDPSMKPGQRRMENKGIKDKLEVLEAVRTARKEIDLGPKPGPRIRSGVFAPKKEKEPYLEKGSSKNWDVALDESDEFPETLTQMDHSGESEKGMEMRMVDLDDF